MKCYRLLTGSEYIPKTDSFGWTVFHMRYYAKDRGTLKMLIAYSGAPSGRIIDASVVISEERSSMDYPPEPLPS